MLELLFNTVESLKLEIAQFKCVVKYDNDPPTPGEPPCCLDLYTDSNSITNDDTHEERKSVKIWNQPKDVGPML